MVVVVGDELEVEVGVVAEEVEHNRLLHMRVHKMTDTLPHRGLDSFLV